MKYIADTVHICSVQLYAEWNLRIPSKRGLGKAYRKMASGKKTFVDRRHHETVIHEKQKDMLHKLEEFLHAYYDLLDETGGPPNKYNPLPAVNEGIEAVEHLWWDSLDDDG